MAIPRGVALILQLYVFVFFLFTLKTPFQVLKRIIWDEIKSSDVFIEYLKKFLLSFRESYENKKIDYRM